MYLIFLLPLIYYIVFRYAPIVLGFVVAFKRFVPALGIVQSKWVGHFPKIKLPICVLHCRGEATIGLFYAVNIWNSYFAALIYLKDKAL